MAEDIEKNDDEASSKAGADDEAKEPLSAKGDEPEAEARKEDEGDDGEGPDSSRADSPKASGVENADPPAPVGGSPYRKLLRLAYWTVFFVALPFGLACLFVWALTPPSGVEAHGPFGWLQTIVREQPVPVVIVAFTVFETAIWFARHKLPLAAYAYLPLPAGVATELRGHFERARALIDEAERLLRKQGSNVTPKNRDAVRDATSALAATMARTPFKESDFVDALVRADEVVDTRLGQWRKSELREYFESIVIAVGIAMALRQFVAEAFKIPSGSMIPTLQVGDHIFVNKLVYGPTIPFTKSRLYARMPPERGDVMVFQFPEHPEQDFIKRVIAAPGDTLEAKNGHPWLNGWEVPSCFAGVYSYSEGEPSTHHEGDLYVEFLEDEAYLTLYDHAAGMFPETQGPYKVAPGEVWVMGDNRHNSHDSRMWFGGQGGGVPFANIKGRAAFVWLSMGDSGVEWGRFGAPVMGRPRLPPAMKHLETGLTKCLKERPPLDKTSPPPAGSAKP